MTLPAIDLGLMTEHLGTHEGMINKLKIYYQTVRNPILKNLLYIHIHVLRNHVRAMLAFIDSNQKGPSHLHSMEDVHQINVYGSFTEEEKDIVLEARATAKLMASDNFMSALMMEDTNVKHVHIEMALQEVKLQSMYNEVIKYITGDFTPKVTEEMQQLTFQKYYHVLKE
ncbi:hypothetical protein ACA30_13615 [Virgibacillus soli]|nr:hypothetical protein ACA30_13615 [Virgibacillus soli]